MGWAGIKQLAPLFTILLRGILIASNMMQFTFNEHLISKNICEDRRILKFGRIWLKIIWIMNMNMNMGAYWL